MESNDFPRFRDFLRTKLPSWKNLTDSDIEFFLFSSITNKVYKVTSKTEGVSPQVVILRNFCGKEGIVDKDKEIKVFNEMSKTGFGPKCYAQEGDIRLEEFIPSRTIHPHEYKEKTVRRKLARTLAAIHCLEVPEVERIGLFESILKDPRYFRMYDEKCEEDIYSPEEKKVIETLKKATSKEEQNFIDSILPKDDIVFSHNDLLQGNILISQEKEDTIFIDYEYASYNFRGYDIGNMFKEATFDYGVSQPPYFQIKDENFPNDEELRDFLRYYLVFVKMSLTEITEKGDEMIENEELVQEYLEKYFQPEALKERIEALVRETMIGVMLSYYYWLVWGVKMHKTVDIPFDYLEFSRLKYERYLGLKKKLFDQ